MECFIREMTQDDWESVSRIYSQALLSGFSTFQKDCPSFEDWDKTHINIGRLVAVDGERVVGWCALSPTSLREAYKGVVEVSIYIDENYRNTGVGTKLLKAVCDCCEFNGYWCLYAAIISINKASISLHKKCGFREIGFREKIARDRFGVWQDTVLMEYRNSIK